MFRYFFKKFISLALSVAVACAVALFVRVENISRFSALRGERTFFLNSASSQGLRAETLSVKDIFRVKGECVRFDLKGYDGGRYALNGSSAEEFAQNLAKKYDAEIVMVEEACGVISFYAYTGRWGDFIYVDGRAVNLHIAVNGEICTVGSPIVFDGF